MTIENGYSKWMYKKMIMVFNAWQRYQNGWKCIDRDSYHDDIVDLIWDFDTAKPMWMLKTICAFNTYMCDVLVAGGVNLNNCDYTDVIFDFWKNNVSRETF